jgi:RNA 2',3'-cyclic 3'-phosphodiesterase
LPIWILIVQWEMLRLPRVTFDLDLLEYWTKSQAVVLVTRRSLSELAAQTDQLRTAVTKARRRSDDKSWRAHVTLARKVAQAPVLKAMSPIAWVSESFCLMSSKIGGNESVYTVVDSWPLLDRP